MSDDTIKLGFSKEKTSMKRLFLSLFAVFLVLALPLHQAEAKRFGGGKSSGVQRQAPSQGAATPSPQSPAGAAANPGKRSWLGPVAGLAAGLGLAALASHLGLGAGMANLLLIALLVIGAVLLFKLFTRNRTRPAPPYGMQYAGAGLGGSRAPSGASTPISGSAATSVAPAKAVLPAGFDADAFAREAKLNFLRLQAAYDAGNLDDIRDFTSPEMYAEIKLQIGERGDAQQRTDVVHLDAEVVECSEEANRYLVSVRFHGLIREEKDAPAQAFIEIWHLTRPAVGSHGWVVAGIQQVN
jgi:predicted lipid-binding transport protein (Tim44 family)